MVPGEPAAAEGALALVLPGEYSAHLDGLCGHAEKLKMEKPMAKVVIKHLKVEIAGKKWRELDKRVTDI